jgi:hypothetical protein
MDVYHNHRRDLLVLKKGALIPAAALQVSPEIESAIKTRGYYMRKVTQRPKTHAGL